MNLELQHTLTVKSEQTVSNLILQLRGKLILF